MKSDSFSETHLTDEQLIAGLYGVGPANDHIEGCEKCQLRRSSLRVSREGIEFARSTEEGVSFDFLAVQRRAIYAKLEARSVWPKPVRRRWAPVALTLLVLGSGAAVYERQHAREALGRQPSDAQLALEVSQMSQEWQGQPAAPLEGLFE
jgi:hypothetical protein